jgi:hypothetical protein
VKKFLAEWVQLIYANRFKFYATTFCMFNFSLAIYAIPIKTSYLPNFMLRFTRLHLYKFSCCFPQILKSTIVLNIKYRCTERLSFYKWILLKNSFSLKVAHISLIIWNIWLEVISFAVCYRIF